MQFIKITIRPYTQPEAFSLGLRSMKKHFNIFPGQHNHQTSISLNNCGQLYWVGWTAHSLIHQLSINYRTFCRNS